MPWIIGGAALGGALISANATNKAGGAQSQAANTATAETAREYNLARSDLSPYQQLGSAATGKIAGLLGLQAPLTAQNFNGAAYLAANPDVAANPYYASNPYQHYVDFGQSEGRAGTSTSPSGGMSVSDIMALDPGYQFRMDQGSKALTNAQRATGMFNSGATGKALTRYGQDYASNEYGNIFNRLTTAAGMGQGATNTGVNAGANASGTIGGYLTGAGNARGAAAIGVGNAYSGALNTVGNYYGQQQTLDKILNRGGYTGGSNSSLVGYGAG